MAVVETSPVQPSPPARLLGLWRMTIPARHHARVVAPGPHLVHLVVSGGYQLDLAGHRFQVRSGDLIWYRGGEAVRWHGGSRSVRFLSCRFEAPTISAPDPAQRVWPADVSSAACFHQLWVSGAEDVQGSSWAQHADLCRLLAALELACPPAALPPWDAIEAWVLRRGAWTLRLAAIAAAHGVSQPSLDRWCRARHGCGPGRRLRRLRLEQAATLLSQSPLPIASVAERLGFRDPSELARACRRHFGRSPSSLRAEGHCDHPAPLET